MEILKTYIKYEETIKGSRFLSELFPCDSQAGARELVKKQKAKYADATHVVHAFVIGPGAEVMGMSDDGEKETITRLEGNGDFRSEECTKIKDECDIVITNEPFSLFRDFIYWLDDGLFIKKGDNYVRYKGN